MTEARARPAYLPYTDPELVARLTTEYQTKGMTRLADELSLSHHRIRATLVAAGAMIRPRGCPVGQVRRPATIPASSPTSRALGTCLREKRLAHGLAIATVAVALNLDPSELNYLELGRRGIRTYLFLDLLTIYGVTDDNERMELIDTLALAQHEQRDRNRAR